MTNTIAQFTVSLLLATNWTGVSFKDKELGYVVTNHVATVVYEGKTNDFTLNTVASDKAVWRDYKMQPWVVTNFCDPLASTNLIYNNLILDHN